MAGETLRTSVRFVAKAAVLLALGAALIAGAMFASARPAPPARPGRVPVRYWHMWTAEWKVVVDRIVERFNQSQDKFEVVALSIPSGGGQANTKFLLGVIGGDPPDLMTQWNSVIPAWASRGLLTPLDSLMIPEDWAKFQEDTYPVARKIGMFRGRLYGVTIGLNMFACYYLPAQLRAEGLDPARFPHTLEELSAWGDRLNRVDPQGQLTRVGFMPNSWLGLVHYAPLFGGGFYDWKAGRLALNTPENLRALEYLAQRRHALGYENVLRFEQGMAAGGSGLAWPFLEGAYSICLDGQWRIEQIAQYAPDLEYAVAPSPPPMNGVPGSGFANGNFMIIPKGARNVEGAWEFIRFWSGLEQPGRAAEFYTWGGWLPLNRAIADAPAYREYLRQYPQFQTFVDLLQGENIQPLPPVPYQVFVEGRIRNVEELAMRGTLTPPEAMAKLEEDVQRELRRRKDLGHDD